MPRFTNDQNYSVGHMVSNNNLTTLYVSMRKLIYSFRMNNLNDEIRMDSLNKSIILNLVQNDAMVTSIIYLYVSRADTTLLKNFIKRVRCLFVL